MPCLVAIFFLWLPLLGKYAASMELPTSSSFNPTTPYSVRLTTTSDTIHQSSPSTTQVDVCLVEDETFTGTYSMGIIPIFSSSVASLSTTPNSSSVSSTTSSLARSPTTMQHPCIRPGSQAGSNSRNGFPISSQTSATTHDASRLQGDSQLDSLHWELSTPYNGQLTGILGTGYQSATAFSVIPPYPSQNHPLYSNQSSSQQSALPDGTGTGRISSSVSQLLTSLEILTTSTSTLQATETKFSSTTSPTPISSATETESSVSNASIHNPPLIRNQSNSEMISTSTSSHGFLGSESKTSSVIVTSGTKTESYPRTGTVIGISPTESRTATLSISSTQASGLSDVTKIPSTTNPPQPNSKTAPTRSTTSPVISILTADGSTWTFEATVVTNFATKTEQYTTSTTDSEGFIFAFVIFPNLGGAAWKFPCLIFCSKPPVLTGPPPGILGGGSGGGGGGGGGDPDHGNPPQEEGKPPGPGGTDTPPNGSDPPVVVPPVDGKDGEGKSDSSSSPKSSSSSECTTRTGSSCWEICTPLPNTTSMQCSQSCVSSAGCDVTNSATTTTLSCNNLPCRTLFKTTIHAGMTSEVNCPDCRQTTPLPPGAPTNLDPQTAATYLTVFTITICNIGIIDVAPGAVDTAKVFSLMQSIQNKAKTRRASGMVKITTSSTRSVTSNTIRAIEEAELAEFERLRTVTPTPTNPIVYDMTRTVPRSEMEKMLSLIKALPTRMSPAEVLEEQRKFLDRLNKITPTAIENNHSDIQ